MTKPTIRQWNGYGTLALSIAAAALVATPAQAAPPDPLVVAAVQRANANANIESISKEANTTADRIGTGEIKLSNANVRTLATGLADAIVAKPSAAPPSSTDPNRLDNKGDEIAEVAAFIQEGIANNPKYKKLRVAKKRTLTLLKGVLQTAKVTVGLIGSSVFRDVAGSVALTIHNDPGIKDAKETKLMKFLRAKTSAIAGKENAKAIRDGFKDGFGGRSESNLKYEDGNIDTLSTVSDPETDIRPA